MTNFKVGMKVVCVDDKHFTKEGEIVPAQDEIYTIRDMHYVDGRLALRFEEIVNSPRVYIDMGFNECAFWAEGFKPIQYQSATSEILERFKLTEEKADVEVRELQNNN